MYFSLRQSLPRRLSKQAHLPFHCHFFCVRGLELGFWCSYFRWRVFRYKGAIQLLRMRIHEDPYAFFGSTKAFFPFIIWHTMCMYTTLSLFLFSKFCARNSFCRRASTGYLSTCFIVDGK